MKYSLLFILFYQSLIIFVEAFVSPTFKTYTNASKCRNSLHELEAK